MRRRAIDIAISSGILVLGLVEVLSMSGYQMRGLWVASVLLTAGVLLFRRRAPLLVMAALLALIAAGSATDPPQDASFWFFGTIVATYALGAYAELRVGLAGLGLVLAFFTVGAILGGNTVSDVVFISILFCRDVDGRTRCSRAVPTRRRSSSARRRCSSTSVRSEHERRSPRNARASRASCTTSSPTA